MPQPPVELPDNLPDCHALILRQADRIQILDSYRFHGLDSTVVGHSNRTSAGPSYAARRACLRGRLPPGWRGSCDRLRRENGSIVGC